jgi:hypothetical protein
MANTGEFLKQHPMCCFCGGQTPASEIDHQPARIIFPDKHRPKGLEFPACADCNRQTSADEALLAFVCRFAGSHRTNAARDFNRLKDIVGSVNQSFPGLRQKMHGQRLWAMERGVWVRVGAIDVNQPEVNLGRRQHPKTAGSIPSGHTVRTRVRSNMCRISFKQFRARRSCKWVSGTLRTASSSNITTKMAYCFQQQSFTSPSL